MSKQSFVWAIRKDDGRLDKCYASEENRGSGKCAHIAHQRKDQSIVSFLREAEDNKIREIFSSSKIEVLPYRMTEEEKSVLQKVKSKKDITEGCENGGYIEMDEALWNDMDKNYFCEKFNFKKKDINAVLMEEQYMILDGEEMGKLVPPEEFQKYEDNGYAIATGVPAMNAVAEQLGFEATKDIYVLPLYMRRGTVGADGEIIDSDLTESYKRLFSRRKYGELNAQKGYEELLTNTGGYKSNNHNHKKRALSDLMKGKNGVWRHNMTGYTIPYAGRAVIVPNTDISYDETKLPAAVAADIFKPTINDNLRRKGFTAAQIDEVLRDAKRNQSEVLPMTKKLIQDAIDDGNVRVILNRTPTLHAAGLLGLKPKVGDTACIEINPLLCKGYNADFDGDTMAAFGINSPYITDLVDKELHPDNFKFEPKKHDKLMMEPTKDAKWGIMNVLKKRSV